MNTMAHNIFFRLSFGLGTIALFSGTSLWASNSKVLFILTNNRIECFIDGTHSDDAKNEKTHDADKITSLKNANSTSCVTDENQNILANISEDNTSKKKSASFQTDFEALD